MTAGMFRSACAVALLALAADAAAGALVDPTRPYDGTAAASAGEPATYGPVLQSTVVSPTHKSATISGKRVQVGDTYEGAVVIDISPFEVRMQKGGQEVSLRLQPKLTKEKGAAQ